MKILPLCLLILLLAAAPVATAATTYSETEIDGGVLIYDSGTLEIDEFDSETDPLAGPDTSTSALSVSADGFAGARASSGLGWLRSAANTEAQTGANSSSQYLARATSSWTDTFTFTTADTLLIGTNGTVRLAVATDGGLLTNVGLFGSADASVSVSLRVSDVTHGLRDLTRTQSRNSAGVLSGDSSLFLSADIAFVWNQPFDVTQELLVAASSSGFEGLTGSSGIAQANYGNTSEWQGFSGVFDSVGNPVNPANYSFSSGSGVDFTQPIQAPPVPEPSAAGLAGAALAALMMARFRAARASVAAIRAIKASGFEVRPLQSYHA